MTDHTRTNTGYKHNIISRNLGWIIFFSLWGLLILFSYNWAMDKQDRNNFCNSLFPLENFNDYEKNKLENEYCHSHIDSYNYENRYLDIPPREYK